MTALPPAPSMDSNPPGGARAILAAQIAKLVIRFATAAALARLLTPDEYGLHGMAMALYGFLYMARDCGVFAAMQRADLPVARFNALCHVAALAGVALASLCAMLGPVLAWFFSEPRVSPIAAGLGVSFLIGGLAVPPNALLYRGHRVGAASLVEAGATLVSSLGALAAAAAGWGVWSLVLLASAYEATAALAAWSLCGRRPGLDVAGVDWRELAEHGAGFAGHGVASYFARASDQVIAGLAGGTSALGFYGRGAQATIVPMMLAIAPYTGWAVTGLARLTGTPLAYSSLFRQILNGLLHFSLPAAILCFAAPEPLVRVLYGASWLPAAGVVHWLGIALLVQPWIFAQVWLLQSTMQSTRLFASAMVGAITVTGLCVMARPGGITSIAAAAAAGTVLHAAGGLLLCLGRTPVRSRDFVGPAVAPAMLHGPLLLLLIGARGIAPAPWWLALALPPLYYALAWSVPVVRREVRAHFLLHRP